MKVKFINQTQLEATEWATATLFIYLQALGMPLGRLAAKGILFWSILRIN